MMTDFKYKLKSVSKLNYHEVKYSAKQPFIKVDAEKVESKDKSMEKTFQDFEKCHFLSARNYLNVKDTHYSQCL